MESAGVPLVPGYHGDDAGRRRCCARGRAHRLSGADQGDAPAAAARACASSSAAASFAAALASCQREAKASLRRRPRADRALPRAAAPHRDPGVRRHARQRRPPVRARLLGAAPPPEGARGSAGAGHDAGTPRARWARPRSPRRRRSATSAPARSSSSPSRTARFYFMEMNTRLQVEHPVTEMITGLDLVEWQLRVAAGEPLPLRAGATRDPRPRDRGAHLRRGSGRAASCRRPARSCTCAHAARSSTRVRIDTGVEQGDEITPFYDPMIAKLIVLGRRPRARAARACAQALARVSRSSASTTNVGFLRARRRAAARSRAARARHRPHRARARRAVRRRAPSPDRRSPPRRSPTSRERRRARGVGAAPRRPVSPWHAVDGWRLNSGPQRDCALRRRRSADAVRVRRRRHADERRRSRLGRRDAVLARERLRRCGATQRATSMAEAARGARRGRATATRCTSSLSGRRRARRASTRCATRGEDAGRSGPARRADAGQGRSRVLVEAGRRGRRRARRWSCSRR